MDCWRCRRIVDKLAIDPLSPTDEMPTICKDCYPVRKFRDNLYTNYLKVKHAQER